MKALILFMYLCQYVLNIKTLFPIEKQILGKIRLSFMPLNSQGIFCVKLNSVMNSIYV